VFIARLLEHFIRFWLIEHHPVSEFLPHMAATFSWHRFAATQIWILVLFLIYVTATEFNHLFGEGEIGRTLFTRRPSELQLNRRQRIRELARLTKLADAHSVAEFRDPTSDAHNRLIDIVGRLAPRQRRQQARPRLLWDRSRALGLAWGVHRREPIMKFTGRAMTRRRVAAWAALTVALTSGGAGAQKPGGVLRIPQSDSPASMSIHEESTIVAERPMMAVFNNLVMFDQHIPQNRLDTIVPDLAVEWSWNAEATILTFRLRRDVKWHDGKPFTARDVKCTWDLLQGNGAEELRINPRKSWYLNLAEVTINGDFEASFHLKRPQPSFIALLASGWSPVYPCHVPPRQMRKHPIGTGPFQFVEFRPNESIKLTRNPNYWKPGRPYLDGIEYTIIRNVATWILALGAHEFDRTEPVPISLLKEIKSQAPEIICEIASWNASRTASINRAVPPFDNPELRRAIMLSLDRKAFINILGEGQGDIGATMQPPPDGVWGMPADMLRSLPGYGPDIAENRAEAKEIMQKLGYGPDKRLAVAVATRSGAAYRNPAVILIDQLKEIYVDGTLNAIDTAQWYPTVMRKEYTLGVTVNETGLDDPDQMFYENYFCGSARNYTGYCNAEVDKLIDRQSAETDPEKRRQIVWQIEKHLAEDGGRPIIFHPRGAICSYPEVKGITFGVNSPYNLWRMEDAWLDR
jgi:peptide/nickel transport system substrate-binding protein